MRKTNHHQLWMPVQPHSGWLVALVLMISLFFSACGGQAPTPAKTKPVETSRNPGTAEVYAADEKPEETPPRVKANFPFIGTDNAAIVVLDSLIQTPKAGKTVSSVADGALLVNGNQEVWLDAMGESLVVENLPPGTWYMAELRRRVTFRDVTTEYRYFPKNERIKFKVVAGKVNYLGRVSVRPRRDFAWNGDAPFGLTHSTSSEKEALATYLNTRSGEDAWTPVIEGRYAALGGKRPKKETTTVQSAAPASTPSGAAQPEAKSVTPTTP